MTRLRCLKWRSKTNYAATRGGFTVQQIVDAETPATCLLGEGAALLGLHYLEVVRVATEVSAADLLKLIEDDFMLGVREGNYRKVRRSIRAFERDILPLLQKEIG